jgi:hypothetical protein
MTDRAQHLIDGAERMALSAHRGDSDADRMARLAFENGALRSDVRRLCSELDSLPWLVRNAPKAQCMELMRVIYERFPNENLGWAIANFRDEIDEENTPVSADDVASYYAEQKADEKRQGVCNV